MGSEEIRLRREVYREDLLKMTDWMADEQVVAHLNEEQNIEGQLQQMLRNTRLPVFTPQLNRDGSFFLVSLEDDHPIGFLRVVPKQDRAEIVVVIGERQEWGKGYGSEAVRKGVRHAFFQWRKEKVVAKIHKSNERSKHVFKKLGFAKNRELEKEEEYALPVEAYLR